MQTKAALRLLLLGFAGCMTAPGESSPPACVGAAQEALVNGAAAESYLGLGPAQLRAIVQLVDGDLWQPDGGDPLDGLCSGTFIAPGWVVTARHCLSIPSIAVVVSDGAGHGPIVLPVARSVASAQSDVALLAVGSSADAAAEEGLAGLEPIAPADGSVGELAVGDVVEIAGYGLTEARTVGEIRFLAEAVAGIDPSVILLDGLGANGACEGDSGGPLIVRGPDGAPRVLAVLSEGSASCTDEDEYARLDGVEAWIRATLGAAVTSAPDCGTISNEGRCLYGTALWCSAAKLVADHCSGGARCGWDRAELAFRCVDPASDPCEGVDSVGACVDGAAVSCHAGTLERQTCAPCGQCRVNGVSGGPECTASGGR